MRITSALLLAMLAGGRILADDAGRLCMLASNDCTSADRVFHVAPEQRERAFVWIDQARTEVTLATIGPGVATIDVDAVEARRVLLSIPQNIPVTIAAPPWSFTLDDATSLRVLRIPRSVTKITISAPRHRPQTFDLSGDRIVLGRVDLQRYDMLSGRIVMAKSDTPVAAAVIESPAGEVLTQTDGDGRFEIDIDARLAGKWPGALHLRAPGFGHKILSLPPAPQPRRWNRVELSAGGGIRVRVRDASATEQGDVVVELRRRRGDGGPAAWETVGRNVSAANVEPIVFSDVDPGNYLLVCTGREPLAQLAREVQIRAGDVTDADLDIDPMPLRIAVMHGARPVDGAKLKIDFKNYWDAHVTASDGVFEARLWQRGDFGVFVEVPGRGSFWSRKNVGETDSEWRIEIPDLTVSGGVRDRATGAALAGVEVYLARDNGGASTTTDRNGAYRFEFLQPGPVRIGVSSRGYLAAETEIVLGEHDRQRKADFELAKATSTRIRFLLPDGRPAPQTRIFDPAREGFGEADESGEIVLDLMKDETRRFFAVPWQGAFTMFDVTAQSNAQPVVVRFQPGPATLTISAKDEAGKPIGGLAFRLRYNGVDLPEDVLYSLAARDGNTPQTKSDGVSALSGLPLGVYEIWPVTAARGSTTGAAPVRLAAQAGDNPVRLTFTRW